MDDLKVSQAVRSLAEITSKHADPRKVSSAITQLKSALRDLPQSKNEQPANKLEPPKIAEFLLTMLATTRSAEAMIGDLNEHFTIECKEFGQRRAARLYWARTLRSLGPLLWRADRSVAAPAANVNRSGRQG